MLEFTMDSTAIARPRARSRLALIAAGILALFGSLVVTASAQAGYYGDPYYRPYPCSYRCGYPTYRHYDGCSPCGCYRRCYSGWRRGYVYERRYVVREYVERRYGDGGYRRPYGYYPYGGYYRSRPWGYGYGGIGRRWPTPYVGGYEPSAYEEPPRPLEPVGDGDDY
jgi:hypothetical protein